MAFWARMALVSPRFLELMTQQLQPTSGVVKVGKSVKFGWLSQQIDTFTTKETWTVLELLGQYKTSYLVNGKMQTPHTVA